MSRNTKTPGHAEPCPNCQRMHAAGEYVKRNADKHDHAAPGAVVFNPPDVACPCGAVLRYSVPIFKISAEGWVWRIIVPAGSNPPKFIVSASKDGEEMPHTRQTVDDETTASRLTIARNKAEPTYFDGQNNARKILWGYYPV